MGAAEVYSLDMPIVVYTRRLGGRRALDARKQETGHDSRTDYVRTGRSVRKLRTSHHGKQKTYKKNPRKTARSKTISQSKMVG